VKLFYLYMVQIHAAGWSGEICPNETWKLGINPAAVDLNWLATWSVQLCNNHD